MGLEEATEKMVIFPILIMVKGKAIPPENFANHPEKGMRVVALPFPKLVNRLLIQVRQITRKEQAYTVMIIHQNGDLEPAEADMGAEPVPISILTIKHKALKVATVLS